MQESDEEQYDFEYEEDDDDDNGDVDIENKYYNAKQLKTTDPEDAIAEFLGIPPIEEEKGEWGFKGLKQAIKLEFAAGQYEKVRRYNGKWDQNHTDNSCRPLNTTKSFSHMSSPQSRAITPKSR